MTKEQREDNIIAIAKKSDVCAFCPAGKTVCEELQKQQKNYSCEMAFTEWLKSEVEE